MKPLYEYIIPGSQWNGVSNNILSNHTDYNVMLYSRGRYLPLSSLFYTARFNGYCVHGDCRETLIKQNKFEPTRMSVNDITLHIMDQLGNQFSRNLPWGGQVLPGIPHVYPFLTGYEVDFLTRVYELSNQQDQTTFRPGSENWGELAADFAAQSMGGPNGTCPFPWAGFGEIIYYNPKRKAYIEENPLYAGKTPLTPIPEFIQFSHENPLHPIIQIHYWIGDDNAYLDLISWAKENPKANIILCHGGYEKGDSIRDWCKRIDMLPSNIMVEISWTLLDMLYENRHWVFDILPPVHYIYGSDTTPYNIRVGRDVALEVDKLTQIASLLNQPQFNRPKKRNIYWPGYEA